MTVDTLHFGFSTENEEGFFTSHGHLKVSTRGRWFWKRKKLTGYASLISHGKSQKRRGTGPQGVTMTMVFNGARERRASWSYDWTKVSDERTAILDALHELTMEAMSNAGADRFFDSDELYGKAVCSLLLGGNDPPDDLDGGEFLSYCGVDNRKV